jgi:hypothetical protein
MIRAAAMMIGGILLLLVAGPLHALAKSGSGHREPKSSTETQLPREPGVRPSPDRTA